MSAPFLDEKASVIAATFTELGISATQTGIYDSPQQQDDIPEEALGREDTPRASTENLHDTASRFAKMLHAKDRALAGYVTFKVPGCTSLNDKVRHAVIGGSGAEGVSFDGQDTMHFIYAQN